MRRKRYINHYSHQRQQCVEIKWDRKRHTSTLHCHHSRFAEYGLKMQRQHFRHQVRKIRQWWFLCYGVKIELLFRIALVYSVAFYSAIKEYSLKITFGQNPYKLFTQQFKYSIYYTVWIQYCGNLTSKNNNHENWYKWCQYADESKNFLIQVMLSTYGNKHCTHLPSWSLNASNSFPFLVDHTRQILSWHPIEVTAWVITLLKVIYPLSGLPLTQLEINWKKFFVVVLKN